MVLILTVAVAVFSPWIARYPFDEPHFADALTNPNSTYWFGTDHLGRDFFSRVVIGAQVTVLVGLGTVLLAAVISLVVGGVSGFLISMLVLHLLRSKKLSPIMSSYQVMRNTLIYLGKIHK